jgi:hypothetical protein
MHVASIEVDGQLDEAVYTENTPTSGFVQQEPQEGQPATEDTDVWTVEIEIPFKSIRYPSWRDQVWSVQFRRSVRWKNEISHLTSVQLQHALPQVQRPVPLGVCARQRSLRRLQRRAQHGRTGATCRPAEPNTGRQDHQAVPLLTACV